MLTNVLELGIKQWPYRKIRGILHKIRKCEKKQSKTGQDFTLAIAQLQSELEQAKQFGLYEQEQQVILAAPLHTKPQPDNSHKLNLRFILN